MTLKTIRGELVDVPAHASMGSEFIDPMEPHLAAYNRFLAAKIQVAKDAGFDLQPGAVDPLANPHQSDLALWAVRGGRRAIFAAFGLGKSTIQKEIGRLIQRAAGGRFLQVAPLGMRAGFIQAGHLDTPEFRKRASDLGLDYGQLRADFGVDYQFVQRDADVGEAGFYLTNYETVRDRKIDLSLFSGISLDEASCLRSFGSKTFSEFLFEGPMMDIPYRFVATATPSPNEFQELLAYAHFLGAMDIGQARTRFFQRNSEKAHDLTLLPHKVREFWLFTSTYAAFVQKPSDLGHSDDGYDFPDLDVHWHEVPSSHDNAGVESSGQGRLLRNAAIGVVSASREKRDTIAARIEAMMKIRALDPTAHRIIWHDLEAERSAIEKAIGEETLSTVYGTQDLETREALLQWFSDGKVQELGTKPVIAGSGSNFQRFCHQAIFLGIGFKFNDFIQAIHRLQRFLQLHPVRIDIIYTEAEREVRKELERKWAQHKQLTEEMASIIRQYGLGAGTVHAEIHRTLGIERREVSTENAVLVNNDAVVECAQMATNSVDLILTSIPFSTQYEYSPSYNDFGHTDSAEHFWQQMSFLVPNLLRILRPGRVAAIHVKDRIVPGSMTGLGFQTVDQFHMDTFHSFKSAGFAYLGMKTIVTDVVRENNQTYRLGWTEQCKDGSRMGAGMPEYLLLFRKPPTDASNGYADIPVVKSKADYSVARWQIDAHGFMRSDGNRLLEPEDLDGLTWKQIYRLFRSESLQQVYSFKQHVALAESLKARGELPPDFMLLPPQSWHPDVWTDITRMRSLNAQQVHGNRQKHLCPLQFDIVDRVITQFSMKGETVFDPFAGLFTVPLRAVEMGRKGSGVELAGGYFDDGVRYIEAAERKVGIPTLFDLDVEDEPEMALEASNEG